MGITDRRDTYESIMEKGRRGEKRVEDIGSDSKWVTMGEGWSEA